MIDFEIDPGVADLRDGARDFVRTVVVPAEPRDLPEHGLDEALRDELQAAAKTAGLFGPQIPVSLGGLGLDHRGQAVVFEEAGYSLLGPQALHCAAPDEGNMNLLAQVATPLRQERFLKPLAAGRTRSCFAMTEPAPGAGSDPAMLRTEAARVDGRWSLNGRKWFITGADGADFAIVMARTADRVEGGRGATMFLVERGTPGMEVKRVVDALDRSFPGGHAELRFDNCLVADDDVLGEVGEGFGYAQVRLAPARLTHCMRWLGIGRRALDIALDRAAQREAFGSRLSALGWSSRWLPTRSSTWRRAGFSSGSVRGSSTRGRRPGTSHRWPRPTSPRRSTPSSTAPYRCAGASACPVTRRWPGS
jgi:acyl-CoA dehydrogenase